MLTFRAAIRDDAAMLYAWRNDPFTREASLHSDLVSWESHLHWLETTLAGTDKLIFIVEDAGRPVGTVRQDFRGADGYELSWTVAPSERGKHYGQRMVTQFIEAHPGHVTATVKVFNQASIRICEEAGFQPIKTENDLVYFQRDA